MSPRTALATAAEFPALDEDGPALLAALANQGIDAEPAVWSDGGVDWSAYDLVVVRSTWDYHLRRDEFLAWASSVARDTRLLNPVDVLAWNTDKTYLRTLHGAGLSVVPTQWLSPGDTFAVPAFDGSREYVVKPAVSAGSKDTNRYRAGEHDDLAAVHARELLDAGRTVMVQPYLHAVDTAGETALLYLGDTYSHAIRKGPLLTTAMEPVVGAYKEETIEVREPTTAERHTAEQVLDVLADVAPAARGDLLYSRVDLVPGPDGAPVLLELELTEPSMFLVHDGVSGTWAGERFATAIAAALG